MMLSAAVASRHAACAPRAVAVPRRLQSAIPESGLKQAVADAIPAAMDAVKSVKEAHGNAVIGTCTVNQAYGGMRDVISMVWEPSLLDAAEGIRFRGLTLPECQAQLPKAKGGEEPLPEGLLWLLFTGKVPTQAQAEALSAELAARARVPPHVAQLLDNLPKSVHPMSQLVTAMAASNSESLFKRGYDEGVAKKDYWGLVYEDSLNLIASLPSICARIYRNVFKDGKTIDRPAELDWSAAFSRMMGFNDAQFDELMRLYMTIHSDHEGGNVSAHTSHLVASALSDPYLSYSAAMAGLAGPLHGLANQEVLKWVTELQAELGEGPYTNEQVAAQVKALMAKGRVVPGFGHAVLRKTDPRYTCQREFGLKNLPDDPLMKLTSQLYEVVPPILKEKQKIKNPWPNVDAHSGVLLQYYGLKEADFYTVMFGASRALGVLPAMTWARIFNYPIERPKSVDTQWLMKECRMLDSAGLSN